MLGMDKNLSLNFFTRNEVGIWSDSYLFGRIRSDSYHSARIRSECVGEGKVLFKVHNYDFRLYPSISIFLKQIGLYLSIECFNSQSVFCTTFLLKVPFIPWLYIIFSIIICCTKSKIQRFKPFLQLRNVLL